MTEQYAQKNINIPAGGRTQANTVASPDFTLTASDVGKAVILDTTLAAGTATLPRAAEAGAGAQITIIVPEGATNGLTLAVITTGTADILATPAAAPANPAVTDDSSFIVQSDGASTWYIVGGLA